MSLTRERQVLQLLKDYRAWHTAYGGSLSAEDSHIRTAAYGPAALIETGAYWTRKERPRMEVSYWKLEHAITLMRESDDAIDRLCWLVLLNVYLGDSADPGVVGHWRKVKPELANWHDEAVKRLTKPLLSHDLYVVWPQRMTSRQAKLVEQANDEMYNLYKTLRGEGTPKSEAVEQAALLCGYGKTRAWKIVQTREGKATTV